MQEIRSGQHIAGYRVERALGRGGMGVVYLAEDLRLGRNVALKLISPQYAGDEAFRERFLRESRLAASIDHPHIVPVYEAGEVDGFLFLSMRHVAGADLREVLLRDGPMPPDRAITIIRQIGSALDAAHDQHLIHRDVKPANILITETSTGDHAYLSDFGLTKERDSDSGLSMTGQIVGTLDYMAPEQIRGSDVTELSDIYALGCLLDRMLAGRVPYEGTDIAVMLAHLNEPPPTLDGDLARFDPAVATAMAKEPTDRYQTCADFVQALDSARNTCSRQTTSPSHRLSHTVTLIALASTLLVASAGAVIHFGGRPANSTQAGGSGASPPTESTPPPQTAAGVPAEANTIAYPVGRRIHIVTPDGSSVRWLKTKKPYHSISWSPDRTQLVGERQGDLWLIDVDDVGAQTRLTSGRSEDAYPAWSPDGSTIVFTRQAPGSNISRLYTINADERTPHPLPVPSAISPLAFADPGWSPDGAHLVVEGFHNKLRLGQGNVYVMNSDGSGPHSITQGVVAVDPAWSPTGSQSRFGLGTPTHPTRSSSQTPAARAGAS